MAITLPSTAASEDAMAHGYNFRAFVATRTSAGADPPASGLAAFQYLGALRGKLGLHPGTVEYVTIDIQEGTAPFVDFAHTEKYAFEGDLTYGGREAHAFLTNKGGTNPFDPASDSVVTAGPPPNVTHTLGIGGFTNTKKTYYQFLISRPGPFGQTTFDRFWKAKVDVSKAIDLDKKDIASFGFMCEARWDPSAVTAGKFGLGESIDNNQPT